MRTIGLLVLILSLTTTMMFLGACSGQDDNSSSADADETSDDDNDNDDNDDNDSNDDDNDNDNDSWTPPGGLVYEEPGKRIELVDGGSLDLTNNATAVGPDGTIYILVVQARFLVLFTIAGKTIDREVLAFPARQPDLAVDVNGLLHIIYYDEKASRIYYLTNNMGEWNRETVADSVGSWGQALAVDAAGEAHLCHAQNDDLAPLNYYRRNGGAWTSETIPVGDYAYDCDVAVSGDGKVHVVTTESESLNLYFAHHQRTARGWTSETLFDGAGTGGSYTLANPRLAIDSAGDLHTAIRVDVDMIIDTYQFIQYASFSGESWKKNVLIPAEPTDSLALITDDENNPHLFYGDGRLFHVQRVNGYFVPLVVDENGGYLASAAVGPDGSLFAAHLTPDGLSLRLADNRTSAWLSYELQTGRTLGSTNSLVLQPTTAAAWIGYDLAAENAYTLADNSVGEWSFHPSLAIGDPSAFNRTDATIMVALDAESHLHAVFLVYHTGELRYLIDDGAKQTIETIDPNGGFPIYLVLGAGDAAQVVYVVYSYDTVQYATNQSGAWVSQTALTDVHSPSALIDADGFIHFAFSRRDALDYDDLLYADNTSGSLQSEIADPGSLTSYVLSTSIALDSQGQPQIAVTTRWETPDLAGKLKYVWRDGKGWQNETILSSPEESESDMGACRLLLDEADAAYITACVDCEWYGEPELKYATNREGSWSVASIDALTGGGVPSPSFAMDSAGNLHTSYVLGGGLWYVVLSPDYANR